ncbi:hypothetical protein LTR10_015569 [Elasticomyces elasticus]|uniref:F-box domain-containing protein n=1 Tax=Exophiala sideris TaxID=1016849 RepID=A0ABR0JLV9_9EURO|nr:hypothetical protein LTR10_015569 [Elasticomyces elasticus]KAK5032281.1 hypothetical protein LTR13_007499 [Exophiala sideris]KAK5036279.1 hypothetical protein LTS07_002005 [Exophiala sideris]KAK5066662.1 hypothetical protein LTR69_002009 [Exophiala sideris]KAK5180484.1 hypothetical protein LTR44_007242 [Eurotiomycetes sp. CCFEE 6388]
MAATIDPTPSRFFSLPKELTGHILAEVDYHSLLYFRQTCRSASVLIPWTMIKNLRQTIKIELLACEEADYAQRELKYSHMARWARAFPNEYRTWNSSDTISNIHANFITKATRLNCYACLQNLPRECFTDSQVMGRRSLGHKDAKKRFCKVCGVKKGIWERGTTVKESKHTWIVCKGCAAIVKADARYKRGGVCSADCFARVEHFNLDAEIGSSTTEDRPLISSPPVTAIADLVACGTSSTRATRCQRCWSINHTQKAADGALGIHLCKDCETLIHCHSSEVEINPWGCGDTA